jgi:hypothetical protein
MKMIDSAHSEYPSISDKPLHTAAFLRIPTLENTKFSDRKVSLRAQNAPSPVGLSKLASGSTYLALYFAFEMALDE